MSENLGYSHPQTILLERHRLGLWSHLPWPDILRKLDLNTQLKHHSFLLGNKASRGARILQASYEKGR